MAKTILPCGVIRTQAASTTAYFNTTISEISAYTTEANAQRTYRSAGILNKLWINITANDRGESTFRLRKNGANGNQVITIGASATGEFLDSSNTDSIAAGDEVNYSMVTGAGGTTFYIGIIAVVFEAASGTVVVMSIGSVAYSSASTTLYTALGGENRNNATEAKTQTECNTAGTLKNLFVNVSANARTNNTTFKSRRNGANGNMTLTVGASATGIFEDTVNTDSVVVDDLLNIAVATGTGTETLTTQMISTEFETADSTAVIPAWYTIATIAANLTVYLGIANGGVNSATENDVAIDAQISFNLSNLWAYISANSVTATSIFSTRKNAGNGNQSLSIGASATGEFEDTTNTDTFVSTDELNYMIVTGATGTSLQLEAFSAKFAYKGFIPVLMHHYKQMAGAA